MSSPIPHFISTPDFSIKGNQNAESSKNSVLTQTQRLLSMSLYSDCALTPNNTHEILDVLQHNTPYARLALLEALGRSKKLSPPSRFDNSAHDVLTQFFRAKHVHQLPKAQAVLESLLITSPEHQTPEAVKALATLIDRHAPALIQNTLKKFERTQDSEPLVKLGDYLNTLVSHTTAVSNPFWKHHFHPKTKSKLRNFQRALITTTTSIRDGIRRNQALLNTHARRIDFTEENKRREQIAQDLQNTTETITPWINKIVALMAVKQNGVIFLSANRNLSADPDIVIAAVQQTGWALEFANENLRADRNIVQAAVQQDGGALEFANENLHADRNIVLAAVQQDGEALEFASENLRADRDIVLAAVQQDGGALEYASENLRADRDIVLAAVQQKGWALQYASEALRADRNIVLTAVKQNREALKFASRSLRADRNIVLTAVKQDGRALKFASGILQADPAIRRAAGLRD